MREFEGSDACVAPVLTFGEAATHPHSAARNAHVEVGGVVQPAAAPRFSRTIPVTPSPPPERGQQGRAALADWGFAAGEIDALRAAGVGFDD
jgi:alpha-methylacyl-CoA racemase